MFPFAFLHQSTKQDMPSNYILDNARKLLNDQVEKVYQLSNTVTKGLGFGTGTGSKRKRSSVDLSNSRDIKTPITRSRKAFLDEEKEMVETDKGDGNLEPRRKRARYSQEVRKEDGEDITDKNGSSPSKNSNSPKHKDTKKDEMDVATDRMASSSSKASPSRSSSSKNMKPPIKDKNPSSPKKNRKSTHLKGTIDQKQGEEQENQKITQMISKIFQPILQTISSSSTEQKPKEMNSSFTDLQNQLTNQLAKNAEITSKNIVKDMKRIDYFVQDTALSISHQYLLGLNAHFSYWKNKEIMKFIVDKVLHAEKK